MNVIGLDIGGTKIFAGKYDADLNLLDSVTIPTEAHTTQDQVLRNILTAINTVQDSDTKAIGIAWAGFVDSLKGKIIKAPNISVLDGFFLASFITEKTKLPCQLENDARCFALGEYQACTPKPKVCLGLIIGTGVGSGLIINGKTFTGANFSAGEIGHMITGETEIEDLIAGPGLQKYFEVNRLSELDLNTVSPKKIQPRIDDLTTWLYGLLLAYDPDQIIIGGGAGLHFWHHFIDEITKKLNKKVEQYPMQFDIKFSERKNAGAEGAALLGLNNWLASDPISIMGVHTFIHFLIF